VSSTDSCHLLTEDMGIKLGVTLHGGTSMFMINLFYHSSGLCTLL
jgi:hypothetical protein